MSKKINILYLSASPQDQDSLGSDMEFRKIFEKVDPQYFSISSRSKMKATDLISTLAEKQPQVLHFSGHGSGDEIILEDSVETSSGVPKRDVIEVFQHLSKKPRLIFLNACWTAENLQGLSHFIDFVIATRSSVFDSTAIEFAAKFYELLGLGEPVRNAFELARKQFDIKGTGDRPEMYELFVREGAKDRPMGKQSSTGSRKRKASSKKPAKGSNNTMNFKKSNVKNSVIAQGNNISLNEGK